MDVVVSIGAKEQAQFLKDPSLAGAALDPFAFFAAVGDQLGLLVLGPVFTL